MPDQPQSFTRKASFIVGGIVAAAILVGGYYYYYDQEAVSDEPITISASSVTPIPSTTSSSAYPASADSLAVRQHIALRLDKDCSADRMNSSQKQLDACIGFFKLSGDGSHVLPLRLNRVQKIQLGIEKLCLENEQPKSDKASNFCFLFYGATE